MTLVQLVTDLATSQRLCDAGFPQDTALVWIAVHELDDDNDEPTLFPRVDALDDEGVPMWNFVAAPTAEEILKELPEEYTDSGYYLSAVLRKGFAHVGWYDWDDEYIGHTDEGVEQSLVQAATHAYLWWKKEVAG